MDRVRELRSEHQSDLSPKHAQFGMTQFADLTFDGAPRRAAPRAQPSWAR
jgi:hypothetical protein